jgi:Fibrobacter succinogenes major domain (Fib_succ_major).
VDLLRGVARIDLDIVKAPDFKINSIELVGLNTATYIWNNGKIESKGITYKKDFATSPSSTIDLFRIFETSGKVNINVYGNVNNIPVVKKLEIAKVDRNNKYTIVLKGIGESISSTINVLPWNDGEIYEIEEDKTGAVLLKKNYSTLPDGVSIDESKNEVKVSHNGGNMTLAIASNTKVSISSVDGKGKVTVKEKSQSQKDGYVVSLFDVSVPIQKNGMLGYNVVLNIKRPELENVYDYVVIKVEQSPKQITTVKLGGVEWMAYNSGGQDLQMQVYELDGYTQEDMYSKNWPATIGYLFQWGKKYPYKPYISGKHNAGNQDYIFPWTASTHVPCPDGYRLPTPNELRALMPNGKTFPGTYNYNGEEVVVSLKDAGSVKVGEFTCRAKYLEFKSKKSGNVLRIPLSGGKGDKSGAKDASFGKGFKLWSNETTGKNGNGGYAWAAYYWPNDATSFTIPNNYSTQMESYSYVRCIKK